MADKKEGITERLRRRIGEDFSYDGKTWDAKLGFVKKGGK